jgi:ribosomal protein S15P/S13E
MTLDGMHPGVVDGRRQFPKRNTCANSSLHKRLERAKKGIEEHLERHPRDSRSSSRLADINTALKG